MAQKTKLELTWIGKGNRPRLEPRILLEDPAKSYHAGQRLSGNDIFDSRLIFGDNLLALKALQQEFAGKIKCIYIDPPFNTKQTFENYDDGVEHSLWLSLMRDRLECLHALLHESGSCFIHIDDNELAYLMVVADEIFGRSNRISVVTFKQSSASGPKAINPGLVTTSNFILFYAKNKDKWESYKAYVPTIRDDRYNKFIVNIDEPAAKWKMDTLRNQFALHVGIKANKLKEKFGDGIESAIEAFVLTNARRVVRTARLAPKDISEEARPTLLKSQHSSGQVLVFERPDRSAYYFLNGEQLLFYSTKVREQNGEFFTAEPATTIWADLLSNNLHKEGGVTFPNGKKPELLLKRILDLATKPGDWVLDSFAGSGTTGAVAQKMNRPWIMVELLDHCNTQIIPRMRHVIDGIDQDGASKAAGWKGGGGFRYFTLAPSLLEKDEFGNWVINKKYNPAMLAEAVCKVEGFTYSPSDSVYWQHGHSTETDFIYVTTQTLSREQVEHLNDEVGPNRSLLIACSAFRVKTQDAFPNLTLKKIPKAMLNRCEWGHDDYSLEIKNLPKAPALPPAVEEVAHETGTRKGRKRQAQHGATLFDTEEGS